jgi:ADP-ribose pyrophosphatase
MTDVPAVPGVTPWPLIRQETVGQFRLFNLVHSVRRSPTTGAEHPFLRLEAPDWVNVVAITADRMLVLVEQYRHGTNSVTLEIPGGCVDPGETPAEAAVRELEEETGFRPADLREIGVVDPNPAFLSNHCWTFLAIGCRADGVSNPDPTEEIALRFATLPEFSALIGDGTIRHALVVAAHDHLLRVLDQRPEWSAALSGGE